ncbi:MAG: hypothetical protein V4620_14945 [Bacteroidota bacterium]
MEAYIEEQGFYQKWRYFFIPIVFISIIIFALSFLKQTTLTIHFFLPSLIFILVMVMLIYLKLNTRIDEKIIQVKFNLFRLKPKEIKWNEVKTVSIYQYNSFFEFGGWGGYRKNLLNGRVAYNVYGNKGLKIVLLNDKTIVLGSNDIDKMKTYLLYLKDKYQIAALTAIN